MSHDHRVWTLLAGADFKDKSLVADAAFQPSGRAHVFGGLERSFEPLALEAGLTEVLGRIERNWADFSARHGGSIALIRTIAAADLDQRVFAPVVESLLEFSKLLQIIKVLLLQNQELGIVGEETVLRLQKLVLDLTYDCGQVIEVTNAHGGLRHFLSEADRCRGDAYKAHVHEGSFSNGESGCGDCDSTNGNVNPRQTKGEA